MTIGKLFELERHHHAAQLVAPSGAVPVTLTGGAGWVLGVFSNDIIAAGALSNPFDIHWGIISAADTNASYEIVLYYGAADIECARIAFTRTAPFSASITLPTVTFILPKGSRLRAKLMDSVGGSICQLAVLYHTY